MMNKTEFINYEVNKIHDLIAENYSGNVEISPMSVVKVNDRRLNGISITFDGGNVCPTTYLDDAFDAYVNGTDADSIASEIAAQSLEAARNGLHVENPEGLPEFLDKKFSLRLLEASRNREFLKDTPYMEVGNGLVLICDVRLQENEQGCYSAIVNNGLLELMGRDKADVFRQAINESWETDRPTLYSMESKIFGNDAPNLFDSPEPAKSQMYILSNTSSIHGAAALYYPEVQQKISEMLGENYYALPSSTEEFIIAPQSLGLGPKEFTDMVRNANSTVVEPGQILSDSVLKYDRDSGKLYDVTFGRELESRVSERM